MKHLLILCASAVFIFSVISCKRQRYGDYKIYPLSPYTDAVQLKNKPAAGQEYIPEIKTQFYIVDEETDLTDKTRTRLENFILTHLQKSIQTNKAVYFTFYKSGFTFDRRSVQTKAQLDKEHAKDKLAEFEYKDGKLYNFDFYKNGAYYTESAQAERGRSVGGSNEGIGSNNGEQ